jgi:2-methylcitrate dehydratase PrpD
MSTERDISDELAEFASGLTWSDISEDAQHAARRTLANAVGVAVGASTHEAVQITLDALAELGISNGESSILGRSETLPVAWAPLVNGIAMHVEDYDDTHLRTVLHPAAPIVPAALAVGEQVGAGGQELLCAVVAGIEVASHLGIAMGDGHFDTGWHVTGTMGHVGAAAAAGRLLGLPQKSMRHALSLAATQAAGHLGQLGSHTKSLHAGKAAADGVEAALLAQNGFTGPPQPIEGRRGLAALMAPAPDLDQAVERLGSAWEVTANTFKPYSCGIVSHPVIDAGVALRGHVDPDEVAHVTLTVAPVVLDVMGVEEPDTGLAGKFSVYHCFAVGLLDGEAGPPQYTTERVLDPEVVKLRSAVRVSTDPEMPRDACDTEVVMRNGAVHRHRVEHATGSLERPMTDEQLRAKFDSLVEATIPNGADTLWAALIEADELESVERLFVASRPA